MGKKTPTTADPKEIFSSAEVFHEACAVIQDYADKGPRKHLFIPAMFIQAFVCELYLKCLLRLENKVPAETHNLECLFKELSPDSQAAVRQEAEPDIRSWKECNERVHREYLSKVAPAQKPPAVDFDFVLNKSAKAFERIRYAFEKDMATGARMIEAYEGWMAGGICMAIRKRIVTLHPDWAELYLKFGMQLVEVKVPNTQPTSPARSRPKRHASKVRRRRAKSR